MWAHTVEGVDLIRAQLGHVSADEETTSCVRGEVATMWQRYGTGGYNGAWGPTVVGGSGHVGGGGGVQHGKEAMVITMM